MSQDLFITMLPQFQAHMSTGDDWKAHRKLTGDLMASSFLNGTMSERVYESTEDLIRLWKQKARFADARPFDAKQDVSCATLDATWYGILNTIRRQDLLIGQWSGSGLRPLDLK